MDSTGEPQAYNPVDKKWSTSQRLSKDLYITPAKYGAYGLKRTGELYFRYGVSEQVPGGRYWGRIDSPDYLFKNIDYGAYDELVAVTTNGDVVVRTGIVPITKPEGKII